MPTGVVRRGPALLVLIEANGIHEPYNRSTWLTFIHVQTSLYEWALLHAEASISNNTAMGGIDLDQYSPANV